jgi:hypothetical protein
VLWVLLVFQNGCYNKHSNILQENKSHKWLRNRKVCSKRVHIERIIGLGKTYKILTNPFNSTEATHSAIAEILLTRR